MKAAEPQNSPHWLRLPPRFNLEPWLNRCAVWLFGISLLGVSFGPSLLLVYLLAPLPGWVVFSLFGVGVLSMIGLVLLEDHRSRKTPYWQNFPFTKWCYIPQSSGTQATGKRAWVRSKTHFAIISEPGFYILKPSYHVEFVGTPDEMTDYTCRRLNGEL